MEESEVDDSHDRSHLHSRLFSDDDGIAGVDRELFADDRFGSDSDS